MNADELLAVMAKHEVTRFAEAASEWADGGADGGGGGVSGGSGVSGAGGAAAALRAGRRRLSTFAQALTEAYLGQPEQIDDRARRRSSSGSAVDAQAQSQALGSRRGSDRRASALVASSGAGARTTRRESVKEPTTKTKEPVQHKHVVDNVLMRV